MSLVATITLAWAAVHTWAGIQNVAFFAKRRVDLEYLAFAIMSFGFALYTVGAAIITDSTSYAEGAIGVRIAYLGAPAALGAFIAFSHVLVGRPQSRVVSAALVWAAIGAVLNAAGLFADPDDPSRGSSYVEPELSVLGIGWVAVACVALGDTVVQVFVASRMDRDARAAALAAAIGGAAAIHDLVAHVAGLATPYLVEHAAVLVSLVLSQMLARRFSSVDAELAARTVELERAYAELAASRDEHVERERMHAVGELRAVIAHEVRNPLAVMKNAASGLRRTKNRARPDDRATLLDILDEETDRLDRLTASLLAYAEPMEPGTTTLHAADFVNAVRRYAEGKKDVELVVEVHEAAPATVGDAEMLARALSRVVDNALAAMPTGGRLTVTAAPSTHAGAPCLAITITDTGEGMDTLAREKATSPFFTTRPSGIGLGLAIADRIVRVHGGRLEIDSRFGRGTTVTIELPA
jgi:signal transduction histidine kinase